MNCFDTEQLFAFANGQMGAEEVASVEKHLDSCALCRALLAEATRASDTPVTQPSGTSQPASGAAASQLQRGIMLGRYVLLERVGAGGMGVVHAAYDPELDRRVALKLIRIDSVGPTRREQAQARLLREAQATARVIHPNVITIHDVGRLGEHVFLAMEFVEGSTLRAHLQERRDWREVLGLFLQAGRGLAAAHAKGLVHRDFKPDNVLVGRDGRVRITDFGLARIVQGLDDSQETPTELSQGAIHSEWLTRSDMVMGTPAYMAPEQMRGETSDARSDQYSYCVTLYEALYGARPFAEGTSTGERERKRTTELRPPRDSKVPGRVHRAIMRGLSAAPEQRHASMNELLRQLSDSPRSRWGRVGMAVGAGLLLFAGGVALDRSISGDPCVGSEQSLVGVWDAPRKSAVQAVFAASPHPFVADTWRDVERMLDVYSRDWVAAHQEACVATRVRGHQTEGILERRVLCLDQRLKDLSAVVDVLASGDAQAIENASRAVRGLESLAPCADISTLASSDAPSRDPATVRRMESIRSQRAVLQAKLNAGHVMPALQLATTVAQEAHEVGYLPLEAEVLDLLAKAQSHAGQYREATRSLHRAIQAAEASRHDRQAAVSWVGLVRQASLVKVDMDPDEEYPLHAAAAVKRLGGDPRLEATLANNLVLLHRARGRLGEALTESQRALAMARKVYKADEPELAMALVSAGQLLGLHGRYEEGLPFYLEAESIYRKTYGPEHPNVGVALNSIAVHEVQAGNLERALEYGEQSLRIYQRAVGEEHPAIATTLYNIAGFKLELGRAEEALQDFERVARLREKLLGAGDPKFAASLSGMGRALTKLGRSAEAVEHHQRAAAIREKALGPDNPQVAIDLTGLGQAWRGMNAPSKALPPLERALAILERQKGGGQEDNLAEARFELAQVLAVEARDLARARQLAGAAAEYYRKEGRARAPHLKNVEQWLAARASGGQVARGVKPEAKP